MVNFARKRVAPRVKPSRKYMFVRETRYVGSQAEHKIHKAGVNKFKAGHKIHKEGVSKFSLWRSVLFGSASKMQMILDVES